MRSGAGNPTSAAVRSPSRFPAAGPGRGFPTWSRTWYCWADAPPEDQCWERVDLADPLGLCPEHRREIVGR